MSQYKLSIITPAGKVFDDKITSLIAPGREGSFGVLQNHTPFVALLKEGDTIIKKSDGESRYHTGAGILEVNSSHDVLILVDYIKNTQ